MGDIGVAMLEYCEPSDPMPIAPQLADNFMFSIYPRSSLPHPIETGQCGAVIPFEQGHLPGEHRHRG